MDKLVYLHVPHTYGRSILAWIKKEGFLREKKIYYAHNFQHITGLFTQGITKNKNIRLYFVVRDLINRAVGEFIHYTESLKLHGRTNHMSLIKLPKDFKLTDPYDYFGLEVNTNPYCKFLALTNDFNKPIDEKKFRRIVAKHNRGELYFDKFKESFKTLSGLTNTPQTECEQVLFGTKLRQAKIITEKITDQSRCKDQLLNDTKFAEFILQRNAFDVRLMKLLKC